MINLKRLIIFSLCGIWFVQNCHAEANQPPDSNAINKILQDLGQATSALKSYQAKIEYSFSQPILQSQSVRTGEMFYQKVNGRSNLRINFQTLKQDIEKPQEYVVQYLFDGVWLTVIDYQIKEIKKYELADPNHPSDAIELASSHFPIIGFENIKNLEKNFEVSLLPGQSENLIGLHLKVKPDSGFKEKYSTADFWIDKKTNLPMRIIANSLEGDIYEIDLIQPKINRSIDKKTFELKIPKGFGKPEIIPMKRQ